jgi:hypothetical protein
MNIFPGEDIDLNRPILSGLPIWMTFDLASFDLCSKGNDKPDVLFPYHTPEILEAS